MSHLTKIFRLLSLVLVIISQTALAMESRGAFQSTKIGATLQDFSGASNRSFAEGSPGIGAEISKDNGNTYLRYFFKMRFIYSDGKQNFSDAGIIFNSPYKFIQFSPEIGIAFYPIARKSKDMNVYLWGIGGLSYNNLEIKSLPTGSTIRTKDQGAGYGYGAGFGLEYVIDAGSNSGYYLVYGELGFRDTRTNLVNYNQFEVSGITYSVGLGF